MTALAHDELIFDDQETRMLYSGDHADVPFQQILLYALSHVPCATLSLYAPDLVFHINQGQLSAVAGGEPLGQILLRGGVIKEADLAAALLSGEPVGHTLLQNWKISPEQLQDALHHQALLGLSTALQEPPQRYVLAEASALPQPHAGVTPAEILARTMNRSNTLPGETVYRIQASAVDLHLETDCWNLLRWMNGRRTLDRAMRASGLSPVQAQQAAQTLIQRGLIEQGGVIGLRLIVPCHKPVSANYHPPASMKASLFLKQVNGQIDAWSLASRLKLPFEEAAALLVSLHRDGVIDVVRGHQEIARLSEEF